MAVMVVGAGFNGTGAGVLAAALTRLGLGPCFDLAEWLAHSAQMAAWEEATNGGLGRFGRHARGPFVDLRLAELPFLTRADRHAIRQPRSSSPCANRGAGTAPPRARSSQACASAPKDGAGSASAWRLLRKMILQQTFGGSTEDAGWRSRC